MYIYVYWCTHLTEEPHTAPPTHTSQHKHLAKNSAPPKNASSVATLMGQVHVSTDVGWAGGQLQTYMASPLCPALPYPKCNALPSCLPTPHDRSLGASLGRGRGVTPQVIVL